MKKEDKDIDTLLGYFQSRMQKPLEIEELFIRNEYEGDGLSLIVKAMVLFGCIFFTPIFGVLIILFDPEANPLIGLAFGAICMVVCMFFNKVEESPVLEIISVYFYIVGFAIITTALSFMSVDLNQIAFISMTIASLTLFVVRGYTFVLVAFSGISVSLLLFIASNELGNALCLYDFVYMIVLVFLFLKEGAIISSRNLLAVRYSALRAGVMWWYLVGLFFIQGIWLFKSNLYSLALLSAATVGAIVYCLSVMSKRWLPENTNRAQKLSFAVLTAAALSPLYLSPAMLGAILLVLISFHTNYKTGFVLGIMAFAVYAIQFYYNIDFTLLAKSLLLMASGIVFLICYLFIYKKGLSGEKI